MSTTADLPFEESAICKLPLRSYDILDSSPISLKPGKFIGFVDVEHLGRLTDAEKVRIHHLQEQHGVPKICFETYRSTYLERGD